MESNFSCNNYLLLSGAYSPLRDSGIDCRSCDRVAVCIAVDVQEDSQSLISVALILHCLSVSYSRLLVFVWCISNNNVNEMKL